MCRVRAVAHVLTVIMLTAAAARAETQPGAPSPELLTASGYLQSVDLNRQRISVGRAASPMAAAQQWEFSLAPDTEIRKAGILLRAEDLHAGSAPVTVQYVAAGGVRTARFITFDKPPRMTRVMGRILAFDLHQGQLQVRPAGLFGPDHVVTITMAEDTVISQNGERSFLSNLALDDEVTVEYAMKDGQAVAWSIVSRSPRKVPFSGVTPATRPQPVGLTPPAGRQ